MQLAMRAKRDHQAQTRLVAASEKLAGGLGLPQEVVTAVQVQRGDEQTRAMMQREAMANLLELVVDRLEEVSARMDAVAERVKEIEGGEAPTQSTKPASKSKPKSRAKRGSTK